MELLIKTWKSKENVADNNDHNILRLFDIFFSPQVKQTVIISIMIIRLWLLEHSIYELSDRLQNNWRLKDLRKLGNISKISKNLEPNLPPKIKFSNTSIKTHEKWKLNFAGSVLFHTKTRVCLKYFANDCRLWNSLPIECFLSTYDLNVSKSKINRHI